MIKESNHFEYRIRTCHIFEQPTSYYLQYSYKRNWAQRLVVKKTWSNVSPCGNCSRTIESAYKTTNFKKIVEFLDWNIKKDNQEL